MFFPPFRQIPDGIQYRIRVDVPFQIRLPEFACSDKDALKSRLLRSGNIGFDAVADHSDFVL